MLKDIERIEQRFAEMGARAKVTLVPNQWVRQGRGMSQPVLIDLSHDPAGLFFDVRHRWGVKFDVPEVKPRDRHLVLIAEHDWTGGERVSRFLCGHDERSWFVAGVPEASQARSVQAAKDALKPEEVWESMREHGVPMELRDKRWTAGFVRQGEWFFLPRPWLEVDERQVLHDEPIQRGSGRSHVCEFVHRIDGRTVYVSATHPEGLPEDDYWKLDAVERRTQFWREARADATVFARGRIRHPDHDTIVLPYWHKVVMNTESRSAAMRNVAFLD